MASEDDVWDEITRGPADGLVDGSRRRASLAQRFTVELRKRGAELAAPAMKLIASRQRDGDGGDDEGEGDYAAMMAEDTADESDVSGVRGQRHRER